MPKQKNIEFNIKIIGIVLTILSMIVGAIWYCATKCSQIDNAVKSLEETETRIESIKVQVGELNVAVNRFDTDLVNIKKNQDKLGKTQDQLMNEQRKGVEEILIKIEELKE